MPSAAGLEVADETTGHVDVDGVLRALFANSSDATVIVDQTGTITFATPLVPELLGFDITTLVGGTVFDFLHPDDLDATAALFEQRLKFEGSDQGKEVRVRTVTGEWIAVLVTATLLPDERFGSCAITMTSLDGASDRELAMRRRIVVSEYVNRFASDLVAAPNSEAVVDRIRDALGEVALLVGANSAGLFVERHHTGTVEQLASWQSPAHAAAHPIDLRCFAGAIPVLLDRHVVVDDLSQIPADHRDHDLFALAEGASDVSLLATPFDSGGRRGTLVLARHGSGPGWWDSDSALMRGVAALVGRSLQTTWSTELLTLTYQLGPVGFSIRTFDGDFVDCNERYLELYGVDRHAAATRSLFDILLPQYHEDVAELHAALRSGELDRFVTEVEVQHGEGFPIWVRTNVVAMTVPGTSERYVLTAVENITEIQHQRIELEHAAAHDPLTGVANRATLYAAIERCAATTGDMPGLLLIDLDRFKSVNDELGHAAGDHVLKAVAERLKTTVRGADLVARLGGDEFAIVAPGLRRSDVDGLARRLQRVVEQPIAVDGDVELEQTMSIGIALGADCDDLTDLLAKADRALYAAKHAGRRCHQTFDHNTPDELQRRSLPLTR
ncbi:MAG: diguanylate cyclase [Ilumatobacter sp.]|nr:diguanylate cyclase [Ilumatobacter sp.]